MQIMLFYPTWTYGVGWQYLSSTATSFLILIDLLVQNNAQQAVTPPVIKGFQDRIEQGLTLASGMGIGGSGSVKLNQNCYYFGWSCFLTDDSIK